MSPISGIVFDLDGTLVDSRADIARATNLALRMHGLAERSVDEISTFVGDGARALVERAAPRLSTGAIDELLGTFLRVYTENPLIETQLMPGAGQAMARLAALLQGVCTNKPRQTTLVVLDRLGISDRFSAVVAGGDVSRRKPDAMPLLAVAEQLGVPAAELVMVGDGPQDMDCARAAGSRSVAVLGGFATPAELTAARPHAIIESLYELPELIERWLEATPPRD